MVRDSEKINVLNLIVAVFMWLIVGAWTYLIFRLSSENAFDSFDRSANIAVMFRESIGFSISQTFVRKGAIVLEFAFLAFAVYQGMFYTNGISSKYSVAASPIKVVKHTNELCILYSLWLTILVAAFNEYFQLFVEGRDATITDVGIATAGAIVVLLICRMAFLIRLRLENRDESEFD